MSGKNGILRDKAQYTDVLSKAQRQLLSIDIGNTNKKWLILIISMTAG